MFQINKLGQEVLQDYIIEDILPSNGVELWHCGHISIYKGSTFSYNVLFYNQPNENIYIPMFCGCGKKINIIKI